MAFPIPQPSIASEGSQRSAPDLANEAAADRRAAQIRHALTQQTQPQMIRTIDPPSEQDLARQRNERIRLRGNRSVDYRDQLAAIGEERQSIAERLATYRRQRESALRQGHVADVKMFGAYVDDLTIAVEQLALIEADAETGLIAAEEREAQKRAALQQQAVHAEKTYAAWLTLRGTYDQHAAAIATIIAGGVSGGSSAPCSPGRRSFTGAVSGGAGRPGVEVDRGVARSPPPAGADAVTERRIRALIPRPDKCSGTRQHEALEIRTNVRYTVNIAAIRINVRRM